MSDREWRLRRRIDELQSKNETLTRSNNGHSHYGARLREELKVTRRILADFVGRSPKNSDHRCVYCGDAGAGLPPACFAHSDLPALDPAYLA